MTVRVVNVTPPVAGHDWSFVVPAQWLPYFYGATAVLTTSTPVTTIPDETANGNNATVNGAFTGTIGVTGPYAGGLQNYGVNQPVGVSGAKQYAATAQVALFHATPNGSLEHWVRPTGTGTPSVTAMAAIFPGNNLSQTAVGSGQELNVPSFLYGFFVNNSQDFTISNAMSFNVWHHVVAAWDGVNVNIYVDGVAKRTGAAVQPNFGLATQAVQMAGGSFGAGPTVGDHGATSIYAATLTQPQAAAHFAANSSWSAYRTAVLGDGAVGLWGLNTLPSGPSRIVTLKVTDGTNTVAQFPANFASATADSFTWSWQVLGPGAQASTDGKTNSVSIPELQVDAGYVISSVTLDLAGTDQWGPITLWFDDGTGPAGGGPAVGGAGYLNALLVPDYSHRGV